MLGVFLFAAQSSAITFENPGIRLELFLKELSQKAGLEFHCPQYLNNEVLVASFQNQTIDVVKSQLARVVNGIWEERQDGWWLIQTSEQKKAEEALVGSRRSEILRIQIEGLKALIPKSEWTAKEAEKYWIDYQASRKRTGEGIWNSARRMALRLRTPESRFTFQMAKGLRPEILGVGQLKPDFRTFSVHGLPNQVDIPLDVSGALQQYANESGLLQTISSAEPTGRPSFIEIQTEGAEVPMIGVSFFDKNWKYLTSALPSFFLPTTYVAKGESFPLSLGTQATMTLLTKIPIYNPTEENSDAITKSQPYLDGIATMLNATKTDPLGILQGRCWIDFAKSRRKPLLANLEESPGSRRPKTFVPTIEQPEFFVGSVRVDADGWILGRPCNPVYNRAWRMDRGLVQRLAQLTCGPDHESLSSQLQMQDIWGYMYTYAHGVPNEEFLEAVATDHQGTLGALGTLTQDQLARCLRGDTIPVANLPERAQLYITQMMFDGVLNSISWVDKDSESTCPRYCFPNGIQGMRLGAELQTNPVFSFVEFVDDLVDGDGMSIQAFAQGIKSTGGDSSPLLTKKFIVSTIQKFRGYIYLGKKVAAQELELSRKDSPEYTWKTLPDPIRKQVLEAMRRGG